ncbi:hypothetical protein M1446_01430 [Candidatus Dependentiae bacterium]|nr:hypothetical protein [Candidatus Dependentiae bacterium]
MKAIEFITKKKQGGIIEIPKEYANQISGEFRVILILDVKPKKKVSHKREFKALKVKTKKFKFNRDEIYDE